MNGIKRDVEGIQNIRSVGIVVVRSIDWTVVTKTNNGVVRDIFYVIAGKPRVGTVGTVGKLSGRNITIFVSITYGVTIIVNMIDVVVFFLKGKLRTWNGEANKDGVFEAIGIRPGLGFSASMFRSRFVDKKTYKSIIGN